MKKFSASTSTSPVSASTKRSGKGGCSHDISQYQSSAMSKKIGKKRQWFGCKCRPWRCGRRFKTRRERDEHLAAVIKAMFF